MIAIARPPPLTVNAPPRTIVIKGVYERQSDAGVQKKPRLALGDDRRSGVFRGGDRRYAPAERGAREPEGLEGLFRIPDREAFRSTDHQTIEAPRGWRRAR